MVARKKKASAPRKAPTVRRQAGTITGAVRDFIATEVDLQNPNLRALSALAVKLAGELDAGAGMATAAVARELRATLTEIRGDDGDPDPDGDPFAAWEKQLGEASA